MTLEALTSYDELVAASAGDPFVRWMVDRRRPVRAWGLGPGVAWVRRTPHWRDNLTVVATPDVAAARLPELLALAGDVRRITVPFGTLPRLDDALAARIVPGIGDDWEWMLTATAPPAPDVLVEPVGAGRLPDVTDLLARSSPRHSATVADPGVVAWLGVRDGARLVACAAVEEDPPGVPGLASIATDPAYRGRGLGAAVTAAATRWAFERGHEVVTLGMYSDNTVARRLYRRLGFGGDHRWSSRGLAAPPPPPS
ncbi:GNAT family N-acetyltransferase [Angustibacter luteus]|uniref:GNAT family N-acetyltransferase n=1 Tax=Angustibacter luteus TaxID=658456 RepID=A0ABW1JAH3_9ACTN